MRKTFAAVITAAFLILAPSAALADPGTGAGDPTFTVTTEGITLPAGQVFSGNNIHLDYYDADGYRHKVRGNSLTGAAGEQFVSWNALGVADGSLVTFVHVTGYPDKWQSSGKGVPVGPKPDPTNGTDTKTETSTEWVSELFCPDDESGYGEVVETLRETTTAFERESLVIWDDQALTWTETWGDWTETGRDITDLDEQTRLMTDAEYADCGLPPTGAPLAAAGGAIVLALMAGGGLLWIARRATS